MPHSTSRRAFLSSVLGATAAATRGVMAVPTNKREAMLALLDKNARQPYIPAAFFIHFDGAYHFGPPAVQKHLEYFRYTGMDFVKIQYECAFPTIPEIKRPEDWRKMLSYPLAFYQPMLAAVDGLVKAAKRDSLVLMTIYSPFMLAGQTTSLATVTNHLEQDPEPVRKGLEGITDSLMRFVKECVRLGVDGFYASTQGGEAGRFRDPSLFTRYIRPFDLAIMNEMKRSCPFNILHVCDYNAPYADFSAFGDYPGHVVNCNPVLTGRTMAWSEVAKMFGRPCMGGLDRHGQIVTGSQAVIGAAVADVLSQAPRPFILGADCTLPGDISWDNIRTAITAAHAWGGQ